MTNKKTIWHMEDLKLDKNYNDLTQVEKAKVFNDRILTTYKELLKEKKFLKDDLFGVGKLEYKVRQSNKTGPYLLVLNKVGSYKNDIKNGKYTTVIKDGFSYDKNIHKSNDNIDKSPKEAKKDRYNAALTKKALKGQQERRTKFNKIFTNYINARDKEFKKDNGRNNYFFHEDQLELYKGKDGYQKYVKARDDTINKIATNRMKNNDVIDIMLDKSYGRGLFVPRRGIGLLDNDKDNETKKDILKRAKANYKKQSHTKIPHDNAYKNLKRDFNNLHAMLNDERGPAYSKAFNPSTRNATFTNKNRSKKNKALSITNANIWLNNPFYNDIVGLDGDVRGKMDIGRDAKNPFSNKE